MRLRQPLRRLQLPQFAGGGQAVARFGLHRRRAVGQHDVEPPTRGRDQLFHGRRPRRRHGVENASALG